MHVEVELRKIKPNPHRDLSLYPLDEAKVEKLRSSISRTDFWGNVVARERNGCYELAYGHHRIEAARRALGKAASVPIIVLELDDAYMLQMMAADNDDAYAIMPGFILEVVRAAKSFVENGSTVGTGPHQCCGGHGKPSALCHAIHVFLDWPADRVKNQKGHPYSSDPLYPREVLPCLAMMSELGLCRWPLVTGPVGLWTLSSGLCRSVLTLQL